MEARYPCPVCLGTRMIKTIPAPGKSLVLDVCPICGGVWFDKGEVKELRRVPADTVKPHFDLSRDVHVMRCHCCFVSMDRDVAKCGFCGRKNRIDCPVCNRLMKRTHCRDLVLDVCGSCGGVWFDRHELTQIWNPAYWKDGLAHSGVRNPGDHPAWALADSLLYWPDGPGLGAGVAEAAESAVETAGYVAAEAASTALEGAGQLLAGIPGVAEGAVEGLAEAALGVVGEAAVEGVAEAALEAVGEAVVEGVAEVAVEAVAGAAESAAEAILEFIVELIGSALG